MKILDVEKNRVLVLVALTLILLPLGYSLVRYIGDVSADAGRPFLELPAAEHKKCVRETAYMRLHHMDLLKEIREEAVRFGRRGEISLDSCRECHRNRERFCNECHQAVSLNVDCFGCHYYPESGSEALDVGK